MTLRRRARRLTLWLIAFIVGLYLADAMMTSHLVADDSQPASRPASRPALAADVQAVIDRVASAYAKGPFSLDGELSGDFDVAGIKDVQSFAFTSAFRATDTFRHEVKGDVLIVSAKDALHIYSPKSNQYASSTQPADPQATTANRASALAIISRQNPALFIAITGDALGALAPENATPTLGPPQAADGRTLDVVIASGGGGDQQAYLDHETGRLVRIEYDDARMLREHGATEVKRATLAIRYEAQRTESNDDALFAFVPPPGATEAKPAAPSELLRGGEANSLEGTAAPAFTLKTLDDKTASLADAKDSVVVLDFWATWCPPCRRGLPHLAEAAKKFSDKGVTVFAINQQEDAATVKTFLEEQKLSLVTPLDADGAVGKAYLVSGIPQTVVIGRDGKIAKVFVGFGDGTAEELDAAIAAALDKPQK